MNLIIGRDLVLGWLNNLKDFINELLQAFVKTNLLGCKEYSKYKSN